MLSLDFEDDEDEEDEYMDDTESPEFASPLSGTRRRSPSFHSLSAQQMWGDGDCGLPSPASTICTTRSPSKSIDDTAAMMAGNGVFPSMARDSSREADSPLDDDDLGDGIRIPLANEGGGIDISDLIFQIHQKNRDLDRVRHILSFETMDDGRSASQFEWIVTPRLPRSKGKKLSRIHRARTVSNGRRRDASSPSCSNAFDSWLGHRNSSMSVDGRSRNGSFMSEGDLKTQVVSIVHGRHVMFEHDGEASKVQLLNALDVLRHQILHDQVQCCVVSNDLDDDDERDRSVSDLSDVSMQMEMPRGTRRRSRAIDNTDLLFSRNIFCHEDEVQSLASFLPMKQVCLLRRVSSMMNHFLLFETSVQHRREWWNNFPQSYEWSHEIFEVSFGSIGGAMTLLTDFYCMSRLSVMDISLNEVAHKLCSLPATLDCIAVARVLGLHPLSHKLFDAFIEAKDDLEHEQVAGRPSRLDQLRIPLSGASRSVLKKFSKKKTKNKGKKSRESVIASIVEWQSMYWSDRHPIFRRHDWERQLMQCGFMDEHRDTLLFMALISMGDSSLVKRVLGVVDCDNNTSPSGVSTPILDGSLDPRPRNRSSMGRRVLSRSKSSANIDVVKLLPLYPGLAAMLMASGSQSPKKCDEYDSQLFGVLMEASEVSAQCCVAILTYVFRPLILANLCGWLSSKTSSDFYKRCSTTRVINKNFVAKRIAFITDVLFGSGSTLAFTRRRWKKKYFAKSTVAQIDDFINVQLALKSRDYFLEHGIGMHCDDFFTETQFDTLKRCARLIFA